MNNTPRWMLQFLTTDERRAVSVVNDSGVIERFPDLKDRLDVLKQRARWSSGYSRATYEAAVKKLEAFAAVEKAGDKATLETLRVPDVDRLKAVGLDTMEDVVRANQEKTLVKILNEGNLAPLIHDVVLALRVYKAVLERKAA